MAGGFGLFAQRDEPIGHVAPGVEKGFGALVLALAGDLANLFVRSVHLAHRTAHADADVDREIPNIIAGKGLVHGHSSKMATARVQPAEAARIFMGKQAMMKPIAGKTSRLCSFSRWQ